MMTAPYATRLKRYAKKLKNALADCDPPVPLGHCRQAIAAGFGYSTYAAWHVDQGTNGGDFDADKATERLAALMLRDVPGATVIGPELYNDVCEAVQ